MKRRRWLLLLWIGLMAALTVMAFMMVDEIHGVDLLTGPIR